MVVPGGKWVLPRSWVTNPTRAVGDAEGEGLPEDDVPALAAGLEDAGALADGSGVGDGFGVGEGLGVGVGLKVGGLVGALSTGPGVRRLPQV